MGMFSPHSPPPIITICNILTIVKTVVINTLSHIYFEEIVTELVKIVPLVVFIYKLDKLYHKRVMRMKHNIYKCRVT